MLITLSQLALLICCLFQIIGLYLLFGRQFHKIVKHRSVAGISKMFIIFGNVQYLCIFTNSIVYYTQAIKDCAYTPAVLCVNFTLGFYQIMSGYLLNVIFAVVYLVYVGRDQKKKQLLRRASSDVIDHRSTSRDDVDHHSGGRLDHNSNHQGYTSNHQGYTSNHQGYNSNHQGYTSNHQGYNSNHQGYTSNPDSSNNKTLGQHLTIANIRRASINAMLQTTSPLKPVTPMIEEYTGFKVVNPYPLYFIVLMLVNVTVLTITLMLSSIDNWNGYHYISKFADTLSYVSMVAILIQYLPQFLVLYKTKNSSNFTILTYLMLSIGNAVTFIYLLMQGVVNFTTWLPFIFESSVQLTLSLQIAYYDYAYSRVVEYREKKLALRSNQSEQTTTAAHSTNIVISVTDMSGEHTDAIPDTPLSEFSTVVYL